MAEFFNHKIRHRIYINAPAEKVYDTLTSGNDWNAFFTHATEVDPRPGGSIVFRWKDWGPDFYTTDADGKVLEANRPGLFKFEWYPVGRETPTTIEMRLVEQYGGTVLTLTESGYPDTAKGRDMILECACGWGEALTLLKFYIEYGVVYKAPVKE